MKRLKMSPTGNVLAQALVWLTLTSMISAHHLAITSAPHASLPQLKRATSSSMTDCDGVGTFVCATGTCYTGGDGFVGCCSVSNCAARTTCIPFTPAVVQSCNPDTDGCISCPAALPACVTVTNALANQYIMYCDAKPSHVTYSYENIATGGSMALPPSVFASTTSSAPSAGRSTSSLSSFVTATSISLSTTVQTPPTVEASTVTVPPKVNPSDPDDSKKLPNGAIAGIAIGGSIGALTLAWVIWVMIRKHRERREDREVAAWHAQQAELARNPSGEEMISKRDGSSGSIARTNANDENDYLSPIDHERLARINEARDAARIHEIDGSPSTSGFPQSENDDIPVEQKKSWWKPPQTSSVEPNPSSRWSASNAPSPFRAYQPASNEQGLLVSELPSVRHIPSRDGIPRSTSLAAAVNEDGISPMIGGASPPVDDTASGFVSPVLHKSDNRHSMNGIVNQDVTNAQSTTSSIPNPAATVQGPLQWPERLSSLPANSGFSPKRSASPKREILKAADMSPERALTSSNGAGHKWMSAESAMTNGYTSDDPPPPPAKDN